MAIHTLVSRQVIQATREEAWSFFSNPKNLQRITPPEIGFEILSDLPDRMYAGMMIEYRVRPLFGIPLKWLSEITQVKEGELFIDEQRVGPYALWHHEHHFIDLGNGELEMLDRITYTLPLSPFSEIVHPFLVKPQLDRIFAHREKVVAELFGKG